MGHDGVEWVQCKKVESMDERWRAAGGEEHVAALHAIHMSGPQLFAFGQDFRKDGCLFEGLWGNIPNKIAEPEQLRRNLLAFKGALPTCFLMSLYRNVLLRSLWLDR
uniref:HDC02632 n=1 Tax=Drosophila melanogaster TaxID=7227 RepID=Q6IHG3_DROME|nr:TPA_inf: HDC02632 [Drosophila melanogaster]